jgi:hypothetical protein
MFLVTLNNSFNRGTPLTDFDASLIPAPWNELSVNCVEGLGGDNTYHFTGLSQTIVEFKFDLLHRKVERRPIQLVIAQYFLGTQE